MLKTIYSLGKLPHLDRYTILFNATQVIHCHLYFAIFAPSTQRALELFMQHSNYVHVLNTVHKNCIQIVYVCVYILYIHPFIPDSIMSQKNLHTYIFYFIFYFLPRILTNCTNEYDEIFLPISCHNNLSCHVKVIDTYDRYQQKQPLKVNKPSSGTDLEIRVLIITFSCLLCRDIMTA